MATINIRLDDKLKDEAYSALKQLGVTPSEVVRLIFQYIAETRRLPIKTLAVSSDEDELITRVRERLNNAQPGIKVRLDDL